MKNFLLIITLLFAGATSFNAQDKLEEAGFYNNKIKLIETRVADKAIVAFPMKPVGTNEFYNDIKNKIDSLKKQGFYFLFEQVNVNVKDELVRKKIKKLAGDINVSGNNGYVDLLKENGFKFKEELINQPSYATLGSDSSNSQNLDITGSDIVNYCEEKYGEIKLNECEKLTPVYENGNCKGKRLKDKYRIDAVVNQRDRLIANGIINQKQTKIALIYGSGHINGVITELNKVATN